MLYFALKDARWAALEEAFQSADLRWLLIALALVIMGTALKIWRWTKLLSFFGYSSEVLQISRAYLVGQASNILLPFRGGEIIRLGMLSKKNVVQVSQIAGTIAIEKSLDLFSLTVATLLVLPYLTSIFKDSVITGLVTATGLVLIVLFLGMLIAFRYWPRIRNWILKRNLNWKDQIVEKTDQFIQSSYWLRDWKKITSLLVISLFIWALMWLNNLPVFRSVNLPADPKLGLFILVLVYIGLIPALTPGNIAPFYFFAQLGLVTFNIPKDEALAFAILLHAIVTLPILILGGISLLLENLDLKKETH